MPTWNQFLKECAARRVQNGLEAPPARPARRTRRRKTSARFCEENRDQGETELLLTAAEISRTLKLYTSPEYRERRHVLISAIALWSNLHKDTVYEARRGCPTNKHGMSQRVRTVLSRTITHIEKRGMSFKRSGMQWEVFENPPPPHTPLAASLQPSPADHKVIPRKIARHRR
jgi:hypothetical protein